MATPVDGFSAWLAQAQIPEPKLTPVQRGVLQAAFAFQQRCGRDYYSTRLLSHFLLHADTGLKVAQLARLLRLSRPTASRQQGLSSKEAKGESKRATWATLRPVSAWRRKWLSKRVE